MIRTWILLSYYLAYLINDEVVNLTGVHGIFTPKQIVLFLTIIILFPSKLYFSINSLFGKSVKYLLFFYTVCVLSFSFSFIINDYNPNFITAIITNGINILWLWLIGRRFTEDFSCQEQTILIKGILILGLIPLLSGLYEVVKGEYIIQGEVFNDVHTNPAIFFIRGFHIDKVDYASGLAPPLFLSFLFLIKKPIKYSWIYLSYLMVGLFCILRSYSVTGMLGLCGGIVILFFLFAPLRMKLFLLLLAPIFILGSTIFIETEYGKVLIDQLNIKYQRNVEYREYYSFRYIAALICWQEFINHPVFGIGFGNHVLRVFQDTQGWGGGGNAHSIMSVLADLGLVGGIPFAIYWFKLYSFCFRLTLIKKVLQSHFNLYCLSGLAIATGFLVLMRLFFYYHTMGNPTLFIWAALLFATDSALKNFMKEISIDSSQNTAVHPLQTRNS